MNKKIIALMFAMIVIGMQVASAIVVKSVDVPVVEPGDTGNIRIEVENIFQDDVERVSFRLDFTGTPFTPLGSSEDSEDEIESDDEASFSFGIRVDSNAEPGNYEIPFELNYEIDGDEQPTRKGSIGVEIVAEPSLSFSVERENPVIGSRGTINLKIVNNGLAEAKFVSVKAVPQGFDILSENEVYIGTIDSDDFETASFDVLFTGSRAELGAIVSYRDFGNQERSEQIRVPVTVYTHERARELGIVETNYWPYIILIVIIVIIAWFVIRSIRKRMRMKASMRQE